MKQTTVRVNNSTKSVMSTLGGKGETYDDIIKKMLTKTLTDDDELNKFMSNASHSVKACFYLGVLEDKAYPDRSSVNNEIWDEIKIINHENFMDIYAAFIMKTENREEELKSKISAELAISQRLQDITDDEIPYYYVLGRSLSHKF